MEQTFCQALHPADLLQAQRDHPRPRVLQLPCPGAEEGVGGRIAALARFGSWPEFIANFDLLTKTAIEQDSKRCGSLGATFRRQSRSVLRWRCAASDRARGRHVPLIPPDPKIVVLRRRRAANQAINWLAYYYHWEREVQYRVNL